MAGRRSKTAWRRTDSLAGWFVGFALPAAAEFFEHASVWLAARVTGGFEGARYVVGNGCGEGGPPFGGALPCGLAAGTTCPWWTDSS